MTEVKFIKVEWGWKDEPDWDKINEHVHLLGSTPYFYRYQTNSDSYGVLISDKELMDVEVELFAEED